jgi:hypothetical protein
MNQEINNFCDSVNTSKPNKETHKQNEQTLKNARQKSIENARQKSIENRSRI